MKYGIIKIRKFRLVTNEQFWDIFKIRKKEKRFNAGAGCGEVKYRNVGTQ